jgi:UDP-2,3-diacylglucosamine hydrolase
MKRPSLTSLKPDVKGAAMLARIGLRAFGDDSILRALKSELEREGFRIVGPDSILSSLLAGSGPFGTHRPDEAAQADIARGIEVARALGSVDVGQAVVVQQGIVLGVEAVEGTDALLQRVEHLRREGPRGVLVKLAKPAQDRRMDLPTIGPETVRRAEQAGLAGIAVESGGTLILDRDEMVRLADAAGLFVLGLEPPGSA